MLSVIVLTKNEEERIQACLESVKWADEIIIVDNGSTDKTLEIAKKYTPKIFNYKQSLNFSLRSKYEDEDYAAFRNMAFKKTVGDWVLYVDPDERVLADLKDEIQELIKAAKYSAYAISRKNIVFGADVKYGPFWPDWVIRLIKRSDFEEWIGKIHEYPKFKGKLGYSKNSLLHLTHRDLDQIVLKSLQWSKIDAKLRLDSSHPKMSNFRFLKILLEELFYQGIIRKGFFNGTIGVMDSVLQSFSLFMSYVRLWQFQQPQPLDQKYKEIDEKLMKSNFQYP